MKICLLSVCLLISSNSSGQTADDLPIIRIQGGRIKSNTLPYKEKFVIQGSSMMSNDTADLVICDIMEGNARLDQSVWKRPFGSSEEFQLVIQPLPYGKTVDFKIHYFSLYNAAAGTSESLIAETIRLTSNESTKGKVLNGVLVSDQATLAFNKIVASNPLGESVVNIREQKGIYTIERKPVLSTITYPPDWESSIVTIVNKRAKLESDVKKRDALVNDYKNKFFEDRFFSTIKSFDSCLVLDPPIKEITFTKDNLKALENNYELTLPNVDLFTLFVNTQGSPCLPPEGKAVIKDLYVANQVIAYQTESIAQLSTEVTNLQANLKIGFSESFVDDGLAQEEILTIPATTERLKSVSIGTTWGYGFGLLDILGSPETFVFPFLALNFHLGPVDKTLVDDPYLNEWSRWALFFGLGTGTAPKYHGKQLESAGGLAPVAGLSVDISRFITLAIGTYLFVDPPVSAYRTDGNIRSAPFVSTSFDFDAINHLKTILSP